MIKGETAQASFFSLDPSGCVATDVSVFGALVGVGIGAVSKHWVRQYAK